jgi:WD40 repeat protein
MRTLEPVFTLNEEGDSSSNFLAFSPRGLLAAQSSATALWDLSCGRDSSGQALEEPMAWLPGGYIRPRALAWSPDGNLLATGCEQQVALWDVRDVASLNQVGFHAHNGTIAALAWSPDGRTLASCSEYGQMHLWEAETWEILREERFLLPPSFILWSPDGRHLVTNPFTGEISQWQVQIWDVETWRVLYVLDDEERRCDEYTCGAFSPGGEWIALGTEQGYVQLWSVEQGKAPSRWLVFSFHQDQVNGLAWSPDGRYLLSGSRDQHVALWDAVTGEMLYHTGRRGEDNWVEDVAWWDDLLAVCDAQGQIALYQAPV